MNPKQERFAAVDQEEKALRERLARTWAEIDLSSLRHNVRQVRKRVGEGVKILVTVKADAYGHGYERISRTLVEEGIDYLGVANVVEALQVRETLNNATRTIPIMTLGANLPEEMDVVIDEDFIPLVCSWKEAVFYNEKAEAKGKTISAHLKIDTGMGRIGFWKNDCVDVIEKIAGLSNLKIEGIATHFPSADEEDASFSNQQITDFLQITQALERRGINIPIKHTANSGAILNLNNSLFNMVRPGIIIYGLFPSRHTRFPLDVKPVLSLKSRVVFIKEIDKGRTISYGRTFVSDRPMRVATLGIGYGDGYSRMLSNRGNVLIDGKIAPIIGSVTMDQIMVDATAIPEAEVGDEAVLIGRQGEEEISAMQIAGMIGTIPYVVTCSISKRVIRKYIDQ